MEISSTRENGVFRITITNKVTKPGLIGTLAIALASVTVFQFLSIKSIILLIVCAVVMLAYAYFTVLEEHFEVFDSIHGFQHSKLRLIGIKEVQFIHSQRIIMHQVITLQKVITFLSCIEGPEEPVTGENYEKFNLINILSSNRVRKSLIKQVYSMLNEQFVSTSAKSESAAE